MILVVFKKHHRREVRPSLPVLANRCSGSDSVEILLEAARTFAALNNSSTYAKPIILNGSKIPSVLEIFDFQLAKSSSKTNASDRCQPFQEYAIALVSWHVLKLEINLKTIFNNT